MNRYLVTTTTIWSGLSYVFSKDAVRILTDKEIKEQILRGFRLVTNETELSYPWQAQLRFLAGIY
jgi:hypothetical protein